MNVRRFQINLESFPVMRKVIASQQETFECQELLVKSSKDVSQLLHFSACWILNKIYEIEQWRQYNKEWVILLNEPTWDEK